MFDNVAHIVLLAIIFSYFSLVPVFYFLLSEKVKIINMIILSKNQRKRSDLNNAKLEAEKDVIVSFFWPVLIVKSLINDIKRK